MQEVGFVNYVVDKDKVMTLCPTHPSLSLLQRCAPDALWLVCHDQVMSTALGIADMIAANSPGAVQAILASSKACSGLSLEEAMMVELQHGQPVFQHPDAVEGPRAFAQKRKPRWTVRSKL